MAGDIVLDARTASNVPAGMVRSTGMIQSAMASASPKLSRVGMMMTMMIIRRRFRVESARGKELASSETLPGNMLRSDGESHILDFPKMKLR